MKRTIAYISSDDYRNDFGYEGFLVSSNGDINYDFVPATKGQTNLLAHDLLEHTEKAHSNPNCDELMALGAILYHRDHAFYNAWGNDGFATEVADQLSYLEDDGFKLPTSASYCVKERLDSAWDEIKNTLTDEHDCKHNELRRLKSIAYRFLSKGYNRAQGLESRYSFNFSALFTKVMYTLDNNFHNMLYRAELNPDVTFTFEVKYRGYGLTIKENYPSDFHYWDDESKSYWREERLIINA